MPTERRHLPGQGAVKAMIVWGW